MPKLTLTEIANDSGKQAALQAALGMNELKAFPKDILLIAAGQSNMAGWTAPSGITVEEAGDERIRVYDTGRGSELITNGDFFDGSTGWTSAGLTLSASGGVATLTATSASNPNLSRNISGLTIGDTYELTGWIETVTTNCQLQLGTSSPTLVGGQRFTSSGLVGTGAFQALRVRYIATATTHAVQFVVNSSSTPIGVVARLKGFSLRKVEATGSSYPVAVDPVCSQLDHGNFGALGPSPAYHIAKQILVADKATRVVILPAAVGGTALVSGEWASPSGARFTDLQTKLTAALSANPTCVPVMAWIQGEADATSLRTQDQYIAAFTAMITALRAIPGAENMRCIIGSIVPEYIASSATHARIDAAQQKLTGLLPDLFYVRAPLGYQKSGEVFHFSAAGARAIAPGIAGVVNQQWIR